MLVVDRDTTGNELSEGIGVSFTAPDNREHEEGKEARHTEDRTMRIPFKEELSLSVHKTPPIDESYLEKWKELAIKRQNAKNNIFEEEKRPKFLRELVNSVVQTPPLVIDTLSRIPKSKVRFDRTVARQPSKAYTYHMSDLFVTGEISVEELDRLYVSPKSSLVAVDDMTVKDVNLVEAKDDEPDLHELKIQEIVKPIDPVDLKEVGSKDDGTVLSEGVMPHGLKEFDSPIISEILVVPEIPVVEAEPLGNAERTVVDEEKMDVTVQDCASPIIKENSIAQESKGELEVTEDVFLTEGLDKNKVFVLEVVRVNAPELQRVKVAFLLENGSISFCSANPQYESPQVYHILTNSVRKITIGEPLVGASAKFLTARLYGMPPARVVVVYAAEPFVFATKSGDESVNFARYVLAFLKETGSEISDFKISNELLSKSDPALIKSLHHLSNLSKMISPQHSFSSSSGSVAKLSKMALLKKSGNCQQCRKRFTPLRLPHQCKQCLKVYCDSCSSNKGFVGQYRTDRLSRLCDNCMQKSETHLGVQNLKQGTLRSFTIKKLF